MEGKTVEPEWDIYLLAGIGSSPSSFAECKRELVKRLEGAGRRPAIRELFPYGDHTNKLWRQALVVGADLARLHGAWRSGGAEAAAEIRRHSAGAPILFIGHSGGSVAAYKAAVELMDERTIPDFRIIQIGSPKVPIRAVYREKVSYYVAVNENRLRTDPVTLLGSWSGWSRSTTGSWFWDKRKYAPGFIGEIMTLGGHEHYFRNDEQYIHPVRGSNLMVTLDSIWDKIAERAAIVTS